MANAVECDPCEYEESLKMCKDGEAITVPEKCLTCMTYPWDVNGREKSAE